MARHIDYVEYRLQIQKHLYANRDEKGASERTVTKLLSYFKTNKITLYKALYELKGMGNVDCFKIGITVIWFITEKGKEFLNVQKVIDDE